MIGQNVGKQRKMTQPKDRSTGNMRRTKEEGKRTDTQRKPYQVV